MSHFARVGQTIINIDRIATIRLDDPSEPDPVTGLEAADGATLSFDGERSSLYLDRADWKALAAVLMDVHRTINLRKMPDRLAPATTNLTAK